MEASARIDKSRDAVYNQEKGQRDCRNFAAAPLLEGPNGSKERIVS